MNFLIQHFALISYFSMLERLPYICCIYYLGFIFSQIVVVEFYPFARSIQKQE